MFNFESNVVIGAEWNNRYVNTMIDTLSKKAASSVYITKTDSTRQVAMKSLIGLLSGGFKTGDTVKLTVIGEQEEKAKNDLKLAEQLLKGDFS
jgi:phosphotransferase system HPr-like phosphotransfer protein